MVVWFHDGNLDQWFSVLSVLIGAEKEMAMGARQLDLNDSC